jgi:hypothetical protein
MRSLPGLEKFQLVLFSDQVLFPLGTPDRWLDYDPKASADQVVKALAAVKPRSDTDMNAGLKAAFRFRDQGLDTVYLLSDGLPSTGEGLPANRPVNQLSDAERTGYLTRHIRQALKTDWNRDTPGRPRVRINAVGFFYESPEVGAFLWALARENDGSFVGMSRP